MVPSGWKCKVSIRKRMTIQSRRDNSFRLFNIGRIRKGTEPESDGEGGAVQLLSGNGSLGGIAFLGKEFAVPVSTLDESAGGIFHGLGLCLDLGHAGGRADLGLPSVDANTMPELIVESQCAERFGYPRHADESAVTLGVDRAVEIWSEEGKDYAQEVWR